MAGVNVRKYFLDEIKARAPKTWHVVDVQRTLDRPTRITVVVRQKTIRHPNAGVWLVDYVVGVIAPNQSTGAAELRLDDQLLDFLVAFDDASNITYGDATKTVSPIGATDFPSYDVPMTVITRKKA